MRERRAAVSARNITKGFGGQLALQGVDLTIEAATVHAVVGENGAGKSTLIKILTGVHEPDDGTLAVDGHEVTISTPRAARDLGIACIHQDLYLVPTMSVGENLFLASGYPSRGRTKINWRTVREEARKRLDVVDLDVDPQLRVGDLRPAQQQLVALAAALAQNPRILIMDEPTAALGASDSEHLLSLVAKHRDAGASIVFVSHRLDEVLQIADVITSPRRAAGRGGQTGERGARTGAAPACGPAERHEPRRPRTRLPREHRDRGRRDRRARRPRRIRAKPSRAHALGSAGAHIGDHRR
jgi:ABC-type sugar transport system ATPase subunit